MSDLRVFLSHSSKDNDWCDEFVAELKNNNLDVWYDRAGLYVGDQWVPSIERELQGREIFLIVLTPDSWASQWVQRELQLALGQQKQILSVLCKPTQVSGFITSYQHLDATHLGARQAAQAVIAALKTPRAAASSSSAPGPYIPPQGKRRLPLKLIAATLALVIVVIAGGVAAVALLTSPKSAISVTSSYHVGSTPAGAIGTVFHISGQHFSLTAPITFQVDGKSLPIKPTLSTSTGTFITDLQVTSTWPQGAHLLTAEDDQEHTTSNSVSVEVVSQGEANTPGPNGAPVDHQSFTLNVQITGQNINGALTLIITGQPDPNGGKVCTRDDDNRPHTSTTQIFLTTYTFTTVTTCSGTYKGGHLTYIQTVKEDLVNASDGTNCTVDTPYNKINLTGDFTSPDHISGQFESDPTSSNCSNIFSSNSAIAGDTGTFTGTLA